MDIRIDQFCLTAAQAQARTSTVPPREIMDITNECLKNVGHKIEEAADKGYMYIIYNVYEEVTEKIRTLESSKIYFSVNMDMAMGRVRDYLETMGYRVRSFDSGEEILHRISWEV